MKLLLFKHTVFIGIILSILFIGIAMLKYPGGNLEDINSSTYSLTKNYISHLLEYKALNGMDNTARPWGIIGVVLMGITTGIAFARFASKIEVKQYSNVIRVLAYLLIIINILITIPALHNLMVTVGSIFTLLLFFYVTIFFLRSKKLIYFKTISVVFLLFFYGAAYMYFTRTGLDYLPSIQKIIHVFQIIFILSLDYKIAREDYKYQL